MGVSVSGAVLQGVLRNPLVDPYILGLSAGAAFGAAAGYVHAATGFSVASSLRAAPRVAAAIAAGVDVVMVHQLYDDCGNQSLNPLDLVITVPDVNYAPHIMNINPPDEDKTDVYAGVYF